MWVTELAKMKEAKYLRVFLFILNKNVLWVHRLIQTLLFSVVLLHSAWHVSSHLVHHRGLSQFILRFSSRLLLVAHNNLTLFCGAFKSILLTYSMEQSPWEANWFSASQEIPHMLWNPNVHYHIHKGLPPVPVLCRTKVSVQVRRFLCEHFVTRYVFMVRSC
jgi:hypothetical protein